VELRTDARARAALDPRRWPMERRILKLIAQSLVARSLLAATCGAVLGLFIYLVRGIDGYPLYLVVGVTAGVAMAGLVHLYMRSVSLTEIKVNVPQLSQLTFVVNNDAKRTAWEIFIEVSTLRPFLSTWHPRLARFEQTGHNESAWEHNAAFRAELEVMRQHLVEYALSFARLAGVTDPESLVAPATPLRWAP
jgi:hypothetical protein